MHQRLRERHRDEPEDLRWHLHRAGDLDGILDAAAVEDFTVNTTHMSITEAAAVVLQRLRW